MMLSKAFSTGTTQLREYRHGEDVFLDCDEAFIHTDAEEDGGGLACSDTELINSQRKIILDIGKQLGRKLLAGNLNLINISLPVVMFESRSYLQKLADPWVHPIHLERAAACSNPVERMKLTVTWFVAGLQHVFCSWRKPFNPLLGETWQAQLPSGTEIFTEQISHHPPVTAFHMDGRAGLYTFDGLSQPQVSFSSGGLKTSARGYRRITFASDGAVITIKYPYYRIGGLLSGVPHGLIKGSATLTDTRYNITATVSFGPVQGAASRLLTRTDSLAVRIHGPAAAAAAVIAVPDWVTAAAASRPASATAGLHAAAAANGLDSSQVPATVAAAAAAALLAPLQDRQGCCSNMPSMVLSSPPAVASLSVNGYTTYRETASAPCSPQPFMTGTKSSRSSRYSTHSSHDSEDGSVTIHSRRRSKSSNLLSTDSLQWLGKPVKRLTSLSRSCSLKTSSSGGSSNTKPRRYSLSGLGLGACFGGGFSQDNDHCGGSSSGSSRSSSPEVSRINSSRSYPGAGGLCSAPTSPSGPQPVLGGSYSADGGYSNSSTLGSSTVQYKSSSNPKSRLGANSPQPSSWGSRSEVQVQAEAPQGTAAAGQDSSAAAADSDSGTAASAAGSAAAADAQRSEQSITSLSSSGSGSGAAHSCSSASNTQQQQEQREQQQPGHDRQTLDRHQQQQQQQQYYASQPQQLLTSGTGNWLSHLDFGDQRYWTLADDPPEHWTSLCHIQQQQRRQQQQEEEEEVDGVLQAKLCPLHVLLPSDSQLRSDLVAFREGDPEAQQLKELLEHQQRKDAKLRPSFSHIDCAQAD